MPHNCSISIARKAWRERSSTGSHRTSTATFNSFAANHVLLHLHRTWLVVAFRKGRSSARSSFFCIQWTLYDADDVLIFGSCHPNDAATVAGSYANLRRRSARMDAIQSPATERCEDGGAPVLHCESPASKYISCVPDRITHTGIMRSRSRQL
jgi:hypothetical protein